jgi:hypothetical protein
MPGTTDYLAASIIFNLQILPDTLVTGITILAIILANPALVAVAAGAIGTRLLTGAAGHILMRMGTGSDAVLTSSVDRCNAGFITKPMRGALTPENLWHPAAPSVFMSTLGFFYGYGLALIQLYKEEIDAQVIPRSSLISTAIIGTLIVITALLFRYWTGCETLLGAFAGILFGLAIGYLGGIALGYATNRRATNVWGIPLLRDRINSGSPLYVCPTEID